MTARRAAGRALMTAGRACFWLADRVGGHASWRGEKPATFTGYVREPNRLAAARNSPPSLNEMRGPGQPFVPNPTRSDCVMAYGCGWMPTCQDSGRCAARYDTTTAGM